MSDGRANQIGRTDRRGFLLTGAGALAAATTLGDGQPAGAQATAKTKRAVELPKRTLGRTGAKVSILSLGTWLSPGGQRLCASPGPTASAMSTRPRATAPSR